MAPLREPARAAPETLRLESEEEERALYGLGDRTLRRLRDRLGVKIVARGRSVTLTGDARSARTARRILSDLLDRVRLGESPSEAEVDAALARASLEGIPPPGEAAAAARGGAPDPRIVRALDESFVVPQTEGQRRYVASILEHEIVFALGPAGTGKTYLAVACAVAALRRGQYRRIVLTRPAVEAGEHLGFLPGDLQEKVNPYLRPLVDALSDLVAFDEVQRSMSRDVIEVAPLAYMRGRTLDRAFIILDEAQNTTPEQMKMFLTRMGRSSRMVVTGDVTQVDLPRGQKSGLVHAVEVLAGIPEIGIVRLARGDIVRHPLVQRIVDAYGEAEGGGAPPAP
jgi:phosphate starvation-inducible PhoH-like protein